LSPRQGSALSEVWFPHKCALAHRIYQGRVAAGTGRSGGKRKPETAEAREDRSSLKSLGKCLQTLAIFCTLGACLGVLTGTVNRLFGVGVQAARLELEAAFVARSDLLLNLVKAGLNGEQELFTKTVEAVIAEERSKSHHILADSLAQVTLQHKRPREATVQVMFKSPSAELLLEQQPNVALSDLVLPTTVQVIVSQLIEEQQRADLLRSYNLEPRSRMLLTGPPGNGKTSLAEAIATALCVPFFVVRYEKVVNSYLGETAKRLQELFQYARLRQCVLFFDEFDALGKEREDRQESGEIKRVLNSLLLEVDRLPSYVILIAATNHPELLDRAVWRRFQIRTNLPLPDESQIAKWFDLLSLRFPQFNVTKAKRSFSQLQGASYSELQDLAQDVLRRCVLDGSKDPDRVFREQMKLWILNHPKRSAGRNGHATDSDFSNTRNGSASKEARRSDRNSSAKRETTGRTNRATTSAARTGVR
jgi:AAA+ superfamily predicted ATPase